MANQEPLLRGACICEWPDTCGGLGSLSCDGCGGDNCVCICGGEMPCFGCEDCEGKSPDDEFDWDEDDESDDGCVPCSICSCLIGDEVLYGDTWDGRQVCAGCAGVVSADPS